LSLTVAVEDPLQADVRALIAGLDAHLISLSDEGYHMTVEELAQPDVSLFVARDDGQAVACGALRRHGGGIGELKRMYTVPGYQGRGIGGRILGEIIARARQEGLARMVLETGTRQQAAWHLYEKAGFRRCGPVLDYPDTSWSVFYQKELEKVPA
jgi:putative acetyltransferase